MTGVRSCALLMTKSSVFTLILTPTVFEERPAEKDLRLWLPTLTMEERKAEAAAAMTLEDKKAEAERDLEEQRLALE
ncbi:hypothetical protein NDU88_002228 [Pleurodeles waltl]|uniref:Uncharacterized protein n=1 Tax=Pleurodeles waltl TaxID=8319 RepID=A0AAV7LNQ4_PLEWA|nr:hypothetical protein NDU88_002228 [Pleurodeles waltl]